MADNTIKTKILLACDTLANWENSGRVLSKGEIALAINGNKVQVRVGNNSDFKNSLPIDISELADTLTLSASQVKIDGTETTVKAAIEALQGDVGTLQSDVTTLKGGDTVEGSVAKSIADALKAYTPTSTLISTYATKAELTTETNARTSADSALSTAFVAADNALSTAFVEADRVLSTAIDSKIFIEGVSAQTLSIATVSPEVFADKLNKGISANELYIVSADHLYGYGKEITNVAPGKVSSDAATYGQLTEVSSTLNTKLTEASSALNTKIEGINTSTLSAGIAKALSNTFDTKGAADAAKNAAITSAATDATTKANNALSSAKAYTNEEIGKVNTSLSAYKVTVEKQQTANEGYAATYIVKQGGEEVGAPINIPKDFLVKSGTVKTCSADNSPVTGYKSGDKYLDFVVNTVNNDGSESHIYIKLTELVDVYTAQADASEVQIAISDTNVVSAALVDGGVTTAKIADANVTEAKLAAESVTTTKIKDASITQAKLTGEFVFDCGNATA